ncbi:MAG: hypothetical protein QG657_2923 [Acidobacteriota bacterium]|nr:hypothetical protein [Acidobacteriota bacterium]
MRVVNDECLKGMKSPIVSIMKNLHLAIVNIAPERKLDFEKTFENFTFEYLDESKQIVKCDLGTNIILLSRSIVEIVWLLSYAHYVLHNFIALKDKERLKPPKTECLIDLNHTSLTISMKLLEFAKKKLLDNSDDSWPLDIPKPLENPPKDSIDAVANELCLCAIASILHHELAHIRLKDQTYNGNEIEIERQADYLAAEWFLGSDIMKDNLDSPIFKKRALGIAVAFICMNMRGIYTQNFNDNIHPPSYDRLIYTLNKYINEDDDLIWSFVVYALLIHIHIAKITPIKTNEVFDNYFEYANAIANHIADNYTR